MNSVFEYFTHHTFDFRSRRAPALEGYTPEAYLDVVNRGMYRHLLRLDETQVTLAGKAHDDARGDLEWLREKPHGTWAIRALGIALRKTLRRCTSKVTFDRTSFERAVDAAPADALFILAPSHRSYLDFLLSSYLCFQHPELGIPVPHIAAAEEFSRIPFVGHVLQQAQAFYIRRGVGKEVPEVNQRRIASSRCCPSPFRMTVSLRSHQELGYTARSPRQTLVETVTWLRAHHPALRASGRLG